jgi:hypothetical protein
MEVEFNPGLMSNAGVGQSVSRREKIQTAENTMSFERTQALEKTLKETPQVRPEMVTRASALVGDTSYPSDELLNNVAGLLAGKINNQPA